MQKSAFQGNICRLIRNEIDYELNHSPPLQVIAIKLDTLIIPFQWQKGRYFKPSLVWGLITLVVYVWQSPSSYGPFTVEERPGEQWISLKRKFGEKEDIKVEATMFDRSVPTSKSTRTEPEFILHITFVVNISKGISGESLEIVCSAWPDNIEISKLCIRKGTNSSPSSYGGPEFEYADLILFFNIVKKMRYRTTMCNR